MNVEVHSELGCAPKRAVQVDAGTAVPRMAETHLSFPGSISGTASPTKAWMMVPACGLSSSVSRWLLFYRLKFRCITLP